VATKKKGQENIRKITRTGKTSLAVTLPIGIVRKLGWREKQKVWGYKKNPRRSGD